MSSGLEMLWTVKAGSILRVVSLDGATAPGPDLFDRQVDILRTDTLFRRIGSHSFQYRIQPPIRIRSDEAIFFKSSEHLAMSDNLFILALLNDRQIMSVLTSPSQDMRQFRYKIGHRNLPETAYQSFNKASILLI